MKSVAELLEGVQTLSISGDLQTLVSTIHSDSRAVKQDSLFVAYQGVQIDGHSFIDQALEQGATAIVAEQPAPDASLAKVWVQVPKGRKALAQIAAAFFDHPSQDLKVVGVTGTNGKTTIATLGYQACRALGYKAGLISTAGNRIQDQELDATHTTPDSIQLQSLFSQMKDAGCDWVWMEVSSHALDQDRVQGVHFVAAIFSNLTHDHLDYHGTFSNYLTAKKRLFDGLPKEAVAIYNADDRNGAVMMQNCASRSYSYAMRQMADYRIRILDQTFEGMQLQINEHELFSLMLGDYNAYNLTAVLACLVESGIPFAEAMVALSQVKGAEGRFDRVLDEQQKRLGIVDYAHSPDALDKILRSIQGMNYQKGRVYTVVGCGGDRDATKRPVMGRIAAELSDKAILTSDNPRSEDPEAIIEDMKADLDSDLKAKVLSVTDRKQAIEVACAMAQSGDIILVAGKGHEKYQEIKGKKFVFDDKEVLKEALQ